jgi:hypothetical protein
MKAPSELTHSHRVGRFCMTPQRRAARAERSTETKELPTKLKVDGLKEALFEIRFRSNLTPEVFTGQLAGKLGGIERLPFADIPFPIRRSDPNLAHQAILQARSDRRLAKIGEQVFSWHVFPPYPGWQIFKGEVESKLGVLRETIPDRPLLAWVSGTSTFWPYLKEYVHSLTSIYMLRSLANRF